MDMRVGNNRTFTQRVDLDRGADRFATTSDGDPDLSVESVVYSAASAALGSDRRVLMPPGRTIAAGLTRPSESGLHTIEGRVRVDASTVLADVIAQGAGSLSISAGENPLLSAAVQALYECGGKQIAKEGTDLRGARLAIELASVVGDCAAELTRPDSEFGARFETLSRQLIAKAGLSERAAIAANRAARGLTEKMAIIRSGEIALQISDVWANAVVGPGRWSVTGYGVPPRLGDWTASCGSTDVDSDRLFKNLTLQDDFTRSTEDYWRIRSWSASARRAAQPLKACSDQYQERLASFLPDDWADRRSAQVVAQQIRALTATPRTVTPVLAAPWASNQEGYGEQRPSTVFNGGDPTGLVRRIVWRSWGGETAIGDGETCRTPPGGITADCTMHEAVIVASDLGRCNGVTAYRDVGWYVPGLDDETERSAMGDVVRDCEQG